MAAGVIVIKNSVITPTLAEQIIAMMPVWFQIGGPMMWLLLLLAIIISVITLERSCAWINMRLKADHFFINDCFAALNKNDKQQATLCCLNMDTPALNMLKKGIHTLPFTPQEKMKDDADRQVNLMRHGQSVLHASVIIALMLGFLGSILSMIESLYLTSLQNNITLNSVLVAFSHALISSAAGISIALFAFIPYRFFQTQAEKLNHRLKKIRSEFNYICQQKMLITNHLSDIMALQEQRSAHAPQATETVADQSEMPYHYEFKENSDEVKVSIHKEMDGMHKTSQSSLIEMYQNSASELQEQCDPESLSALKQADNV